MAMVWDRELIAAIIKGGPEGMRYVRERKITPEMLGKPYNDALTFIQGKYAEHQEIPSKKAISHLTREPLPDIPSDSIEVLSDYIVNRAKNIRLRKLIESIKGHTKEDGNLDEGLQILKDGIGEMEAQFRTVREDTVDFASEAELRLQEYREVRDGTFVPGVETPWPKLNLLTNGFPRGQVSVILGGTSVGKTMLAVATLKHFFLTDLKALLVSMEASKRQICTRLDGMLAQLPSREIATGRLGMFQEPRLEKHLRSLQGMEGRLYIAAGERIQQVEDLDDDIKKLSPKVVVVDAMYFLKGKGREQWQQQGDVVQELKGMARRHDVSVVVTSQFSKEGMKRKDGGRLTETGFAFRIVQDSPLVIAVKEEEPLLDDGMPLRKIEVLKNSEGPLGSFVIKWDCELAMDFSEVLDESEEVQDVADNVHTGFGE